MPANRRSLRRRLAWAFFLLTTFALMVLIVALFVIGEEQESDLIDEVMNSTLDSVIVRQIDPERGILGGNLSLYRAPIGSVPVGVPAPVAALPAGLHEWLADNTEYHIGIREHNGERLYLFYDETGYSRRLAWLYWSLAIGGVALSLLSLWLGYWIARKLLHQFEQLAAGLNDGECLLARPEQDREVALLAQALDDYRAHNAELIASEREFTANVSHELRTPLTRIRTSAELLAEGGGDSRRAQRIVLAVDDLERRLKGLLFLARGAAVPEVGKVALQPLIDGLLAPYRENCEARGILLENRVEPQATVEVDPDLLALLFDNLLRNAVNYTEAGSIRVGFENGWLVLRDTGIGIPEDLQARVFERHFRIEGMRDGSGLGLAIVREIAARCGWRCELKSRPGEGTEIRLRLPS